jgi:hypothetical protein
VKQIMRVDFMCRNILEAALLAEGEDQAQNE